jgi:hypothetical protein
MAVNHTECYWKRSTTLVSVSEKLDVVEARTLLRFQHPHKDIGHQHDTTTTITCYPQFHCSPQNLPPERCSLVAQFHFCRLGRRSFPIVAPRPQLHLDLLISRRTTFCPEQEEPQNTQICKIHPKLLEYRSNRHQKLSFNNHLLSASRESWIKESKRIEALVFNRPGMSPRPPQFAA